MRYALAALALLAVVAGLWFLRPSLAAPPLAAVHEDGFRIHVRISGADPELSSRVYNALSVDVFGYPIVVQHEPEFSSQHTGWGFGGKASVDGEGSMLPGHDGAAVRSDVLTYLTPILDRSWERVSVTCDTRDGAGAAVRYELRMNGETPSWVAVE